MSGRAAGGAGRRGKEREREREGGRGARLAWRENSSSSMAAPDCAMVCHGLAQRRDQSEESRAPARERAASD